MIEKLVSYAALGAALASPVVGCGDDAKSLCEDYCDAMQSCCDERGELCSFINDVGYSGCISNCEEFSKTNDVVAKGSICIYEKYNSCDWGAGNLGFPECFEEHD
ncbi:MAG: hypothetical protein ABH824_01810 [Nanoarchaeota archaeon]|nr:hypothetical protein [Nanoarchaeota archaeon]MBU1631807.1 hypothetical protein [Nanoarchaeota archaeon]MBU1876599.1 hypothetical protein [Nanoarchaeota archaeon]